MDRPDMARVESFSKAPGHLGVSVGFFPSPPKVIVGSDVLVHFLEKLLQGLRWLPCKILCRWSWSEPLDHGFNDNLVRHCRRLGSKSQETSDVRLQVLIMVMRTSELKGKCALGPFLSILVIECQHKCLNVNLYPWMDIVQNKSKGMFLSLSTLF
jgi:hypothetical protein